MSKTEYWPDGVRAPVEEAWTIKSPDNAFCETHDCTLYQAIDSLVCAVNPPFSSSFLADLREARDQQALEMLLAAGWTFQKWVLAKCRDARVEPRNGVFQVGERHWVLRSEGEDVAWAETAQELLHEEEAKK